jgi:hypothetical protein
MFIGDVIEHNHKSYEIIDFDEGAIERQDQPGFYEHGRNAKAWLAWELDEDGERTDRTLAYAGNNADGEAWETKAETIQEALLEVDQDWLKGMLMPGEDCFGFGSES